MGNITPPSLLKQNPMNLVQAHNVFFARVVEAAEGVDALPAHFTETALRLVG